MRVVVTAAAGVARRVGVARGAGVAVLVIALVGLLVGTTADPALGSAVVVVAGAVVPGAVAGAVLLATVGGNALVVVGEAAILQPASNVTARNKMVSRFNMNTIPFLQFAMAMRLATILYGLALAYVVTCGYGRAG